MRALDHFIGVSLAVAMFGIVLILVGMATKRAEALDPAPSALTTEVWTPCEPPRPGVECWRSGHAVVCLPPTEEKKP
jgi:hypothetical protein